MRLLKFVLALLFAAGFATDASAQGTARVKTRTYFFKEAGTDFQYKLFVSTRHQQDVPAPLIIALHPFGTNPQGIMLYQGLLDLAEQRGYIVAAPTGLTMRAWFGNTQDGQLSELDVLNVLRVVREEHTVDPKRIYLMGHSMGGGGTWYFGTKYPDIWAALAPVAPSISVSPDALTAMTTIPVIVIQGDADRQVNVDTTRRWVAKMKELGMSYEYVEVPGGDHTGIISRSPENMKKIFDFFGKAKKK